MLSEENRQVKLIDAEKTRKAFKWWLGIFLVFHVIKLILGWFCFHLEEDRIWIGTRAKIVIKIEIFYHIWGFGYVFFIQACWNHLMLGEYLMRKFLLFRKNVEILERNYINQIERVEIVTYVKMRYVYRWEQFISFIAKWHICLEESWFCGNLKSFFHKIFFLLEFKTP